MTFDMIFLNGPSSAGKTAIAKRLQERLDGIWLHVTLDMVFRLLPEKFLSDPDWGDKLDWDVFLSGFHAAVRQLPCTGFPVILDHVCTSRRWRDQCVQLFADYAVLHVGVCCSLAELRRREVMRGDRKRGIAEEHLRWYAHARPFDLEVDTGSAGPDECAAQIMAAMESLTGPTAFERIRSSHHGDPQDE
jgi:chloramphenicol 3-O phosphotransferase